METSDVVVDPIANPNPKNWWFHRRLQSYIGVLWAIVQTGLWTYIALTDSAAMNSLGAVVGWSYGISVTLIISYYGNTAISEYIQKKSFNP